MFVSNQGNICKNRTETNCQFTNASSLYNYLPKELGMSNKNPFNWPKIRNPRPQVIYMCQTSNEAEEVFAGKEIGILPRHRTA